MLQTAQERMHEALAVWETRLAEYRAGRPWREEDERAKKDAGR